MDNFFGHGTGSSIYDERRHINLVYYTMMELRLMKNEDSFLIVLRHILSSGYDKDNKAVMICQLILSNLEFSYLNYLSVRYGLSEDEFITILAGESLVLGQVKSPAGYQGVQNWELIVQMIYATMLCGPEYQGYVQQLIRDFFYPLCSGMKGVTLQRSTFRIITENINSCLDQGKRLFTDLPYIENYVINKLGV